MTQQQQEEFMRRAGEHHRQQQRAWAIAYGAKTEEEIAEWTRFEVVMMGGGLPPERIVGDASRRKR